MALLPNISSSCIHFCKAQTENGRHLLSRMILSMWCRGHMKHSQTTCRGDFKQLKQLTVLLTHIWLHRATATELQSLFPSGPHRTTLSTNMLSPDDGRRGGSPGPQTWRLPLLLMSHLRSHSMNVPACLGASIASSDTRLVYTGVYSADDISGPARHKMLLIKLEFLSEQAHVSTQKSTDLRLVQSIVVFIKVTYFVS